MARATPRRSSSRAPAKRTVPAKKAAAKKATKQTTKKAVKKAPAKKAAPKKPAATRVPAKKAAAKAAPAKAPKAPPKPPAKPAAEARSAKAPPAPPVPKPKKVKPEVDAREIRKIKARLLEEREELTAKVKAVETDAATSQSESSGEVSYDEDYADAGSYTFEREKEMSLGYNHRDLLDKVNHALEAIERKRYGICVNCGNAIAKARLQALPYSTLCLTCKKKEERTR